MKEQLHKTNTFQLAGIDERERGFNRQAEVIRANGRYQAVLHYETLQITVENCETQEMALFKLIGQLHDRGYTQIRTRQQFRGETYLGNQEEWVDHPDPTSTG